MSENDQKPEESQELETTESLEEEQASLDVPADARDAPEIEDAQETALIEIPDVIPILPLRDVVVYPLTAQPLNVGQPRSVELVNDAVKVLLRKKVIVAMEDNIHSVTDE